MKNKSAIGDTKTEKLNYTRRIAMLAVIGISMSGTHWMRPVVDSVILPAHASTTSTDESQYFADVTDRLPVDSARNAVLCVTISDGNYTGRLAVTYNDGQIDIFTNPSTPLGDVSIMTGQCREGGPFLAANPDQQGLRVAFEEDVIFSIPMATCALPVANCTSNPAQAALSKTARGNVWE